MGDLIRVDAEVAALRSQQNFNEENHFVQTIKGER